VDSQEAAIGFVLALARALHRYGTPADRLEAGLQRVCNQLGLRAEVFTTPTAIIMSFGHAHELRSSLMRVEGGELDMGKLQRVDSLADAVAAHRIDPAEGMKKLGEIIAGPPRFGRALSMLAHGVTAGSFAVFFGGSIEDVILAAAIGLTLGLLAQVLQRSTDQNRVFELVGSAFAAFSAGAAASYFHAITPSVVTIAALVILLPGLALSVAMTELATKNLIAGTARLMSAVIVLLELVIGVAIGERLAHALFVVHQGALVPLPEWANWVALGASSVAVAIIVQAEARAIGWIVNACFVAYVGARFGSEWLGGQLGALVGAFALGLLANLYARLLDRPAQIVSVPAVLVLVPGGMGFRGIFALFQRDTLTGVETVFAMFVVATAIAAGLLIANALVSSRRSL
jgi:uncharacterized membrane protein YjjP (DUF1212 family)